MESLLGYLLQALAGGLGVWTAAAWLGLPLGASRGAAAGIAGAIVFGMVLTPPAGAVAPSFLAAPLAGFVGGMMTAPLVGLVRHWTAVGRQEAAAPEADPPPVRQLRPRAPRSNPRKRPARSVYPSDVLPKRGRRRVTSEKPAPDMQAPIGPMLMRDPGPA